MHLDRLCHPRAVRAAMDAEKARDQECAVDHLVGLVGTRATYAARPVVRRPHAGLHVGSHCAAADAQVFRIFWTTVRTLYDGPRSR